MLMRGAPASSLSGSKHPPDVEREGLGSGGGAGVAKCRPESGDGVHQTCNIKGSKKYRQQTVDVIPINGAVGDVFL